MGFDQNNTFGFGSGGSGGGGGGITAAQNGLSLNGTTVEWGQEFNAPGNPAALLHSTQIPIGDFFLGFSSTNGTLSISDGMVSLDANSMEVNPVIRVEDSQILQSISMGLDVSLTRANIIWASDDVGSAIHFASGQVYVTALTLGQPATDAFFEVVDGGIATEEPSPNGPGVWRLGKVRDSLVTLDSSRYIEVEIDGVVVPLAIVIN